MCFEDLLTLFVGLSPLFSKTKSDPEDGIDGDNKQTV